MWQFVFLSLLLALPTSFWQIHKNDKNVPTFCFPSTLVQMFFSEEPWLINLFSDSFSFAIFSLSCKYSISDFCDTIKVSKLDKDGRWNTYFKKHICKYNYSLYYSHICKYLNITCHNYSENENFISIINCKSALA